MHKFFWLKTFLVGACLAFQLNAKAQPVSPPNLSLPLNNSMNTDVYITFWWSVSANATVYNLIVSSDSIFSSIEYDVDLSTTNFTCSELNYGDTYYWKVRASNATDTSAWSPVWNFTCSDTVNLISPANNAAGLNLYPFFNWTDIGGTHRYYIEMDTTPLFNSPVKSVDSTIMNYYNSVPPMFFAADYYWRVQARNLFSVSAWTSAFHFTTVDQLLLSFPPDGATNQMTTTYFGWSNVAAGCNYNFQSDTSAFFNSPLLFDTITASHNIWRDNLLFGQTYYWRVQAETNVDTLSWSSTWSFSSFSQILLVTPANDSLNSDPCLSFSWTPSPNSNYILEIDTTSAFNSPVKIDTTDNTWIPVSCYDQDYYWRITEFNASDTLTSPFFHFTTYKKPTVVPPPDTANADVPTIISWVHSCLFAGLFAEYKFDEDSLFGSPISGTYTNPFQTGANLLHGVHYFGTLRIITADDTSDWGYPVSFTTELQTSPIPILLYPPNGAYGVPPPALLKWQNVGAAYDYRIRIDTTTAYLSPVYFSTPDTFYYAPLALNHIYYWEVQAHDSSGYCDWSYFKQFSTWNVGINEMNAAHDFTAYPNPFRNELILYNSRSENEIIIFDLSGKVILQQPCTDGETIIDTKSLSPGFYLLNCKGEKSSINIKIFKF